MPKGSAASREGNGELRCCSCCSVEKGLSLLTDFSSHRKHHSENKILHLPMCPSTGSKNQTGPLVFSISFFCFPPCQAEQSRHWHLQLSLPRFAKEGCRGCPGYPGASLWELTANHISINHHPTLCRFGPAASELRRRCQKSLPGASSSLGLLLCLPWAGAALPPQPGHWNTLHLASTAGPASRVF